MVEERLKQQYRFSFHDFSIIGKRAANEDRTLVLQNDAWQLILLADGMGGHLHGDIAAEHALDSIAAKFTELNDLTISQLNPIFAATNKHINEVAAGSGTTIGGVYITSGRIDIFWAGDVRIYLKSQDDKLHFVSKDHTLITLLKSSNSPIKSSEIDRMRNTVTRSLGLGEHGYEPDVVSFSYEHNITGFICSDGVHNMISDDEIFSLLCADNVEDKLSEMRIKLNLKAKDNATAVLFACQK